MSILPYTSELSVKMLLGDRSRQSVGVVVVVVVAAARLRKHWQQ